MAKRKKKRIASRGSVNNIILRTLVNGDKYGYEIIKEVEDYSQGKILLKQPSLYSSLTRFEDKGFVSSYWGDSEIGGRRHYYHLTEKGMQYYKINILKETEDKEETLEVIEELNDSVLDRAAEEEKFETDEIEDQEETIEEETQNLNIESTISQSELLKESDVDKIESDSIEMMEVDEKSLPAIVQFEVEKNEEIIPDHNFYTNTPIDNILINNTNEIAEENIEEKVDNIPNSNKVLDIENSPYDKQFDNTHIVEEKNNTPKEIEYPWLELASIAKKSRDKVSQTSLNTLYLKQRPKPKKVILDSDGIYKLRDVDYIPTPKITKSKESIIDNVGKRTNNQNTYSYTTYTDSSHKYNSQTSNELSEEEKRRKNESFVAKFNMLTMSRMKPVSSPIQQTQKEPIKDIDYRGKLDNIINSSRINEEQNKLLEEQTRLQEERNRLNSIEQNNLFNYVDDEVSDEEDEDRFIDFEPAEEFETKTESNEYVSKITNYSNSYEEIKLNRYETKSNAVLIDKTYILINKLKFVFGIIMSILLVLEVLITQSVLKSNGMIVDNDNILFVIGYCLAGVVLLFTTIPFIVSHNEHKCNNFKLRYAFWFGLLTFLVLTIIIYCVNALIGFELEYFSVFATKLILPIVVSFNFVLGPIIYYFLTKIPRFYD